MNIKKITEELRKGNLVITPTDTTYGIMADATNKDAIKKVFDAKKRENKPLILLVSSMEMLEKYTSRISPLEYEIINKYLPGNLTILLRKNERVCDIVTCNSPLVGIRIPNNKDLIKIISNLKVPVISTSANLTNEPVITNINEINKDLLKYISYIEDGKEINACPSTIIKVENEQIIILRNGEITKRIIKDYSNKVIVK